MLNVSGKYGRSLHAHISEGTTSDDRLMPEGYVQVFADIQKKNGLVMSEKLDGQNDTFKHIGLFARSHAAASELPWDKPLRERWEMIKDELGDLEIFGENMYGVHSIAYENLESYFYVFGVREGDTWLSWEDVKIVAAMFNFPVVPQIEIKVSLQDKLDIYKDENKALDEWLKEVLGMSWKESVNTPGMLGGYDPLTGKPASEGFVIRNASSFRMEDSLLEVAPNEFGDLFKLVRAAHVKTDEHWTKNWEEAKLKDYDKYGWQAYGYLSRI